MSFAKMKYVYLIRKCFIWPLCDTTFFKWFNKMYYILSLRGSVVNQVTDLEKEKIGSV